MLCSGTLLIPKFLSAFEYAAAVPQTGRALVIIQLSGGNDGLNMFVPFRSDIYYKVRPTLAVKENNLIRMDDEMAFNAAIKPLQPLYDQGYLAVINSVGYPNPDLSHFKSMDIWHSASGSNQFIPSGWIGRYLDASCPGCPAHLAVEADDTLSFALKGEKVNGLAVKNPSLLYAATRDKHFQRNESAGITGNANLDFLYKVKSQTISSAEYLYDKSKIFKSSETYPVHELGKNLKMIAGLIISGIETKVYYVSFSGFDTHSNQKGTQDNLMGILAESISAFTNDLKKNNRLNDTMVMIFSEFGRRVKQNVSGGTDHGTANNVCIISGRLAKKGFITPPPDLSDLDNGNLKHKTDFRSVYATLLKKWLHADDEAILRNKFPMVDFI